MKVFLSTNSTIYWHFQQIQQYFDSDNFLYTTFWNI